jgi:polysaccharide export outer membrane protein
METQQMKLFLSAILGVLLTLSSSFAFAQDEAYRLQPEDVIRIAVYNEPQISGGEFEIGKDGNVSAPFVGSIRAAGKTTDELEKELKELYIRKLRLRDPNVSVTISRFRIMRASVTGIVQRAGTYPFRQGDTIATLLSQAGGPVFDQADLRRARLRRAGSNEEIPIDLESMLQLGDTSQNFALQDGDELIIPQDRENRIVVWGAVLQPGNYPYQKGMRVMDAVALARGEIPRVSKMSEARILRKVPGQPDKFYPIQVNMVRFTNKPYDYTQNIEIQRGDVLFIPTTKTPNFAELGNVLNTLFFANRVFFEEGLFGFRPFSFIGR